MIDAIMSETQLVWIDIETSGLDPHKDKILEIGVRLTDLGMRRITGMSTVINWGDQIDEIYNNSDPFVQDMHTKNRLWQECRNRGKTLDEAEVMLAKWTQERSLQNQPLCGNSLKLDRAFLDAQTPLFHDLYHYRSIDVSSFKVAAQRFNRPVFEEMKTLTSMVPEDHRVDHCLEASCIEFRYYVDNFLRKG
jgi:oligoribonuclease